MTQQQHQTRFKPPRRLSLSLAVLLLTGSMVTIEATVAPTPAQAAAVDYYLPYTAGFTAVMTQGPGGGTSHTGINAHAYDFDLNGGAVRASAPGTIVGKVANQTGQTGPGNGGNYVVLKHADNTCTSYAHMAHGSITAKNVGDSVAQAEHIGNEGNTGYTLPVGGGHHLHFQRDNCSWNSTPVDFVENNWTSQNSGGGGSSKLSDFTGDGKSDFFSLNSTGSGAEYTITPSSGSAFNNPSQWTGLTGWGWNGMKPFIGDFNGDGKADAGAVTDAGGSSVNVPISLSSGSSFNAPSNWMALNWGWGNMKVLAGDFNGDGRDDFLSLNNGGTGIEYVVATSTGGGFNSPSQWSNLQGWGWNGMKPFIGDFNGDGKDDIGSLNDAGNVVNVVVSLSNGSNFQSPQNWINLPWGWGAMKVLAGDFNGDGKSDFFSLNNGGTGVEYVVATSNGSGFNLPGQWSNLQGWGWNGMKPFIGDFNSDGRDDIASLNDAGPAGVTVPVSISTGSVFGSPSNWLSLPWGWGAMNVPSTGVN